MSDDISKQLALLESQVSAGEPVLFIFEDVPPIDVRHLTDLVSDLWESTHGSKPRLDWHLDAMQRTLMIDLSK